MRSANLALEIILVAGFVCACVSLFLGWSEWGISDDAAVLAVWRLVVRRISLFAVTTQFLLFIALWSPLGRYFMLWAGFLGLEGALFLVAAPCAILGNMKRRWWLVAASVTFPVISFFAVLGRMAY